MQILYILRGPQGSGKSTFLSEHGLMPWVVSTDQLRLLYGSVSMSRNGSLEINQERNDLIFAKLQELLSLRMEMGLTTFVDSTQAYDSFQAYKKLAARWNYKVVVVEVGMGMSYTELDLRLTQRTQIDPASHVPRSELQYTFNKLEADGGRHVPEGMTSISAEELSKQFKQMGIIKGLSQASTMIVPDYTDDYDDIMFIGDIQGCATPLKRLLDTHYSDKRLMIFTGDLFDRGPENGEVMQIMDELLSKPNTRLLCGNHERHLLSWSQGVFSTTEFMSRTLPQLKSKGFDKTVAQRFIDKWENLIQFQMGDSLFQVLHGGVSGVIEQPLLFPGYQCWKGSGNYDDDVDADFERNAPKPWHQVHGHRNSVKRDLKASQRSFNLEGGVEHGAELRALRFDGNAFTPILIENKVFIPMIEQRLFNTDSLPHWLLRSKENKETAQQFADHGLIGEQDLQDLRSHALVREVVQVGEALSSFNFTRDAFYKQEFDSCNTRARGLFVNTQTREVVIRGYDKYFNVNERGIESARLENILANTIGPYSCTIKENGSLGLLGYDSQSDLLVFASKTTISGDHALWLREQITAILNPTQLIALKCLLRDTQMCLAFELIEPDNDPHIISYDKRTVILLDGIRRAMAFETIGSDKLEKIANEFGFAHKQKSALLPSRVSLAGFLIKCSKKGLKYNNKEVEGIVVQSACGTMFKTKLPYYNLWKNCRSAAQAVRRFHEKGSPVKLHFRSDPHVSDFIDWLLEKPPQWAQKDIISLRNAIILERPEFAERVSNRYAIDDAPALG